MPLRQAPVCCQVKLRPFTALNLGSRPEPFNGSGRPVHTGFTDAETGSVFAGLAAPFAVVPGRPLERLDLQRDAVDGDDAHLLTGGDRASPGSCGPASGRRRR